ncbi:MAG: rhodanese-like domain-containing protein [Desulfovibrio sp.]
MKKLVLFVLMVSLMALTACAGADSKFAQEVDKEKAAIKLLKEVERGGYGVISTEELKKMINNKKEMVIIDAMPYEASYKKGHIPGAVQFLFPIPDMNEWDRSETDGKTLTEYENLLGRDKDKLIVVYCGFVKCTRSHNAAIWAKKLGYTNVVRHPGGIFAWKGAGNKVATVQ